MSVNKKTRPLRQARSPHPQRRLKVGKIVIGGNFSVHIAAIIQHFHSRAILKVLTILQKKIILSLSAPPAGYCPPYP
jgi:hypothetical protein